MMLVKIYVIVTPIMLVIDYVWLAHIIKPFFAEQLKGFETTLRIFPALVVYLIMPLAIILFVLPNVTNLTSAILWGALFGLVLYGIYDFTNYAFLQNWKIKMIIVDVAWGIFLNSLTTVLAWKVSQILLKLTQS